MGSPKAGSPRARQGPGLAQQLGWDAETPGYLGSGRTPCTGSHQHGSHTASSRILEAPGLCLVKSRPYGWVTPSLEVPRAFSQLLCCLPHAIPGSCLNPRRSKWLPLSPGTQGHDGWLIAGGFSQILEVFVVVVMDSARQPPPLWLKACQDGSTTVEHKGSAWFLWRSHPDLPSDSTSSLILGFWRCRRDPQPSSCSSKEVMDPAGPPGVLQHPRDPLSPHQLFFGSGWTHFQE